MKAKIKMIKFFQTFERPLLGCASIRKNPVAGLKYYYPKEEIDTSEWPESRKLQVIEKQPLNVAPYKMYKMIRLIRGPELVHNELIYKGYGVKALLGGRMKFEHFNAVRNMVNKKIDTNRMFALWRIDAPWQPLSKKSVGKRMGCGKGATHHYCTPVKADRIIVEIAGDICKLEAESILCPVAEILPFPSRVVSQKDLENEKKDLKWCEENNKNPFTMEYCIRNNMGGCQKMLSKHDLEWFGRYK